MSNLMKNMMKKQKADEKPPLGPKPHNPYDNDGEDSDDEEEEEVGELNEFHNYGKNKPVMPTEKMNFANPTNKNQQKMSEDSDHTSPSDPKLYFE